MEKLLTGVAYHGNRILRHVEDDMRDIVHHNMNLVVHMFSHNDWDRHKAVMPDIIKISEAYGLEVWIDNWGIGGPPGDKSHFLQYHPEAHQVFADGTLDPVSSCYNSEAFVQFTKDWLDVVRASGGKRIFWDEPRFKSKKTADGGRLETCYCESCKKLFRERYGKEMPLENTPELQEFRAFTLVNYFDRVTAYAHSLEMKNYAGIMIHTLDVASGLAQIPHLDNFGTDPYWFPRKKPDGVTGATDPYDYVYTNTRYTIEQAEKYGKGHHIWIQGYDIPAGREDDIILATDAAYDAGARTIIDWSFRGGESNSYRSDDCERCWQVMGEAMGRIRSRHFDAIRAEKLKKYQ